MAIGDGHDKIQWTLIATFWYLTSCCFGLDMKEGLREHTRSNKSGCGRRALRGIKTILCYLYHFVQLVVIVFIVDLPLITFVYTVVMKTSKLSIYEALKLTHCGGMPTCAEIGDGTTWACMELTMAGSIADDCYEHCVLKLDCTNQSLTANAYKW